MKRYFYLMLLVFILSPFVMAGGNKEKKGEVPEAAQWAKDVKVGKYTEKTFDEAALYAAAKEEGGGKCLFLFFQNCKSCRNI